MPSLFRGPEINRRAQVELRKSLDTVASIPRDQRHGKFYHPNDVNQILTAGSVGELFKSFDWYKRKHANDLRNDMHLIICILISIGNFDWATFGSCFFQNSIAKPSEAIFTDADLPVSRDKFRAAAPFVEYFLDQQYAFKPVMITRGPHVKYTASHRLPILEKGPGISGSQGTVRRVEIQKHYLWYSQASTNAGPAIMAMKCIRARNDADARNEREVLERFRCSSSRNERIMQCFATFMHGEDLIIISPWAAGRDLSFFLVRPWEIFHNYEERSHRFSPYNLFLEAMELAVALRFLHNGLYHQGRPLLCAHLDLKPDNILVDISRSEVSQPVGKWMISDFGLSRVEEAVEGSQVVTTTDDEQRNSRAPGNMLREMSFQRPTRKEGAFQPPETRHDQARVSTRRDVWSYGCILATVMAFAIGGPAHVGRLRKRRAEGADDLFYHRVGTRIYLKPGVINWLREQPESCDEIHRPWIQACATLVPQLLNVDVIERPEMDKAVNGVRHVVDLAEAVQNDGRVWDFETHQSSRPTAMRSSTLGAPTIPDMSGASSDSEEAPRSPVRTQRVRSRTSSGNLWRSPLSVSSNTDASLTFALLVSPESGCVAAKLDPQGQCAMLWGPSQIRLYLVGPLIDLQWQERPTRSLTTFEEWQQHAISFGERTYCYSAALAGPWIAFIEYGQNRSPVLIIHKREANLDAKSEEKQRFALTELPPDTNLVVSSDGVVAIRFRRSIRFYRHDRLQWQLSLQGDFFNSMQFTGDGKHFCLWESQKDNHYWTIWRLDGSNRQMPTKVGGRPLVHERANSAIPKKGKILLLPFTANPRFVACDGRQFLYLVKADGEPQVHQMRQTDQAAAGVVLLGDAQFVLIRHPEEADPSFWKCPLEYVDRPDYRPTPTPGKLSKDFDPKTAAMGFCNSEENVERPVVLVLLRSGKLIRKSL
ncbi:uncharacterized protein HMPREF1541_05464 [Cyphellophora europaea CBS 101466]|uniref:Protein kinase domain-containing protein n=1 Tax=Cyphellophora europaea (strain CBS 101466) TaxID=1220924 RepID=W2RRU1_CYPE1|nr:uncharacterized protein HMPREF1541_05464 [Cyphellophora europaea CBS 101466]ETN39241.1 hypothetical protein HMPREF1541_05464 [Cyphellophora europaea CBS 101466]